MSTGYKIADKEGLYYLTFQVVRWIDVFTRKTYKDVIIESLKYCQKNKGLELYAYVIMSNHIHLLAKSENEKLSETIRDFKRHTSKTILEMIETGNESRKEWMLNLFGFEPSKHKRNENYQFWTHENHAEHIYSIKFIAQKLQYIHNNPVRAGYVENAWDYLYSSARNYASLDAVIDVILLTIPVKTVR
jgi:REP element-mobilizing transposase RayT